MKFGSLKKTILARLLIWGWPCKVCINIWEQEASKSFFWPINVRNKFLQISFMTFHENRKAVARTFWHCPLESGSFSSPKVAPTPNKKLKQSSPWCLKTKMGDWISQVISHLSKFQPTCGSRCGPMVCLCLMATYPFSHASKGGWQRRLSASWGGT